MTKFLNYNLRNIYTFHLPPPPPSIEEEAPQVSPPTSSDKVRPMAGVTNGDFPILYLVVWLCVLGVAIWPALMVLLCGTQSRPPTL